MIRRLLLILSSFFLLLTHTFGQSISDNMLLHYLFDGDTNDQNDTLNGIINGAELGNDRFDNNGLAYYFDGASDYIELPNAAALKPEFPLSFAFWVKLDDVTSIDNAIFTNDDHPDTYYGISVRTKVDGNGEMTISYGDGTGAGPNDRRTAIGQIPTTNDQWHFVVGVIRGAQDMEIYIDGIKDSLTYQGSGEAMAYSDSPGKIGKYDRSPTLPHGRYMKGAMDDFMMWDREVTQEEVEKMYDGILLDLPLDGDATDYSGNNINGWLMGTTPTFDRFGNSNNAYTCDSTGNFIEIPDDYKMKTPLPITVSMWINSADITDVSNVYFTNDRHPSVYSGVTLRANPNGDGKLTASIGDGGPAGPQSRRTVISSLTLTSQKWHHIVTVFRGATDFDIYIDGVKDDSLTFSGYGGALFYSDSSGAIGSIDGSSTVDPWYFTGGVDDLKMWHRSLTQSEVEALYTPGTWTNTEKIIREADQITIYPNPTTDQIFISKKSDIQIDAYEIFDHTGRLIQQGLYHDESPIQIGNLNNGIFMVKFIAGHHIFTKRIIKG